MRLNIPFQQFKHQIEMQMSEGQSLIEAQAKIKTNEDLKEFEQKIEVWTSGSASLIAQSFIPSDAEFERDFKKYAPSVLILLKHQKMFGSLQRSLFKTCKKELVPYAIRYEWSKYPIH